MNIADLPNANWLPPWRRIVDPKSAAHFEDELRREMNPRHVLFHCEFKAVATSDPDDVLVLVEGGTARLAVVHLTYSGKPDVHDDFPWTILYDRLEKFICGRMVPEHETFIGEGGK